MLFEKLSRVLKFHGIYDLCEKIKLRECIFEERERGSILGLLTSDTPKSRKLVVAHVKFKEQMLHDEKKIPSFGK